MGTKEANFKRHLAEDGPLRDDTRFGALRAAVQNRKAPGYDFSKFQNIT
jgi:hypothetical protein